MQLHALTPDHGGISDAWPAFTQLPRNGSLSIPKVYGRSAGRRIVCRFRDICSGEICLKGSNSQVTDVPVYPANDCWPGSVGKYLVKPNAAPLNRVRGICIPILFRGPVSKKKTEPHQDSGAVTIFEEGRDESVAICLCVDNVFACWNQFIYQDILENQYSYLLLKLTKCCMWFSYSFNNCSSTVGLLVVASILGYYISCHFKMSVHEYIWIYLKISEMTTFDC